MMTASASSSRIWPRDNTGTRRRYGGAPSLVHGHRGVVAIEAVHCAPVGIADQALGGRIGARRQQHAHDHVVAGAGLVVRQQLLDEARQTADDLIDEAQARAVMALAP